MDDDERGMNDESSCLAHQRGDQPARGLSRAWSGLGRILMPGPSLGFVIVVMILLYLVSGPSESRPGPDLPPMASAKIQCGDGIVGQLAFHPKQDGLFSGGALAGGIHRWDPGSGSLLARYEDPVRDSRVGSMALSPDGRTLAVGIDQRGISVWDTKSGEFASRLAPESWHASALAFTPDGGALIAAGRDGTVRTWLTSTWRERVFWPSNAGDNWSCLAVSPDGRTLTAGGMSGWARVWDLTTGRPLHLIEGDGSPFRCVAYSPDGRSLAAGSWRGRIRMWDAATHLERPYSSPAGLSSIVCMAFAPDGRSLATGHEDRTVRLWEPKTGQLLRELKGHGHGVRSLAFSADGRTLASGAADSTIFVWDTSRLTGAVVEADKDEGGRS